jgi:hypothetical protein
VKIFNAEARRKAKKKTKAGIEAKATNPASSSLRFLSFLFVFLRGSAAPRLILSLARPGTR